MGRGRSHGGAEQMRRSRVGQAQATSRLSRGRKNIPPPQSTSAQYSVLSPPLPKCGGVLPNVRARLPKFPTPPCLPTSRFRSRRHLRSPLLPSRLWTHCPTTAVACTNTPSQFLALAHNLRRRNLDSRFLRQGSATPKTGIHSFCHKPRKHSMESTERLRNLRRSARKPRVTTHRYVHSREFGSDRFSRELTTRTNP